MVFNASCDIFAEIYALIIKAGVLALTAEARALLAPPG
jgi:hypothetical protein